MLTVERSGTSKHVRVLMNLAAVMAECTAPPEHCSEIPSVLSRALDLESLTLGVIRKAEDDASPCLLFGHSCGVIARPEAVEPLHELLRSLYPQVAARAKEGSGENFEGASEEGEEGYLETAMEGFGEFPRAIVFDREIDAAHHVMLVVHRRGGEGPLGEAIVEDIEMIMQELATQLYCLIVSKNSPGTLGEPFDHLSGQEWTILCGLNSDLSEKQLAAETGLSPHTLHSHIKSIYRKFGVQGRLTLLLRLNSAIHRMRMENRGSA